MNTKIISQKTYLNVTIDWYMSADKICSMFNTNLNNKHNNIYCLKNETFTVHNIILITIKMKKVGHCNRCVQL